MKPDATIDIKPALPQEFAGLHTLARNYAWSWIPEIKSIFSEIDEELFRRLGSNPVAFLNAVPSSTWRALSRDQSFIQRVHDAVERFAEYMSVKQSTEFEQQPLAAYFCAEYGLHESFANYSGGLGVLAGDHLKSASDLGYKLVAVGLLYQQGYFNQVLGPGGWQQEVYVRNDVRQMPLEPVLDNNGERLTISMRLPDGIVHALVWKMAVGLVDLYLLDTNTELNSMPSLRNLTNALYSGDREHRLRQELLLGIGGYRALDAMNLHPDVVHLNEGHAAFCTLEQMRLYMQRLYIDIREAQHLCRMTTVFTTHTPVPAGNEVFEVNLLKRYFDNCIDVFGMSLEHFLELGQVESDPSAFSMTVFGMKMSVFSNGVSRLHGQTAREMWKHLWPQLPVSLTPITHITNGVHAGTWLNEVLWDHIKPTLPNTTPGMATKNEVRKAILALNNTDLWSIHQEARARLVKKIRAGFGRTEQLSLNKIKTSRSLSKRVLTIGFARRFATYKRGNLLFGNIERLKELVLHSERPVQVVIAGKAHPHDQAGKKVIKEIMLAIQEHGLEDHIVFLADYDMEMARYLVQGCDIWLNTPRRPMEASGTSGMKAAMNGCLHVSVLDGWWAEGFHANCGWAIPDARHGDSAQENDIIDRDALFTLLEKHIIPEFYDRDHLGRPTRWIQRMKEAMISSLSDFSSHRMVAEYDSRGYARCAGLHTAMLGNNCERLRTMCQQIEKWSHKWKEVHVASVDVAHQGEAVSGDDVRITCLVNDNVGDADRIAVRALYGPLSSDNEITASLSVRLLDVRDTERGIEYSGNIRLQSAGPFGVRCFAMPMYDELLPLEYAGLARSLDSTQDTLFSD